MRAHVCWALVSAILVMSASQDSALGQLVDNRDGTVTDQNTGLMWLKESLDPQDPANVKTWPQAMLWANGLSFAGHDDWRLPSALEFSTGIPDLMWNSKDNEWGYLYGETLGNPANASDIAPLEGYSCLWYWTSTEHPANSRQAAAYFWSYDGLYLADFHAKNSELCLTAVRGDRVAVKAAECTDTYDNDANGLVDFPEDGGCSSADDDWEYTCHGFFGCLFLKKDIRYKCFRIEDSTICIQVIYVIIGIVILAGFSWWLMRRRKRSA